MSDAEKKSEVAIDVERITRRDLIRGATLVGAAVAVPIGLRNDVLAAEPTVAAPVASTAPYQSLTANEAELLEAIVDRLIPSDAMGPGAKEAGVARYIDRALGDALVSSRQAYASGLVALDRYALASRGKPFMQLPQVDRDSVLIDCETGGATGFTGSSAQFFGMVLNHTRQGMFGDPHYGGNANFAGWDLINYPGVRTAVPPDDQKALEANKLKPMRTSAYDFGGFVKDDHHGN